VINILFVSPLLSPLSPALSIPHNLIVVIACDVKGPRCQADRELYKRFMLEELQKQSNLSILSGSVEDLIIENNTVRGVVLCTVTSHSQSCFYLLLFFFWAFLTVFSRTL
jgi:hypothetical protein